MHMKTNGLALKSFYADTRVWSGQDGKSRYWIDDICLAINGQEVSEDSIIQTLRDNDEILILAGVIYSFENLGEVATLAEHFKNWQQSLDPIPLGFFACEVPSGIQFHEHPDKRLPAIKRHAQ